MDRKIITRDMTAHDPFPGDSGGECRSFRLLRKLLDSLRYVQARQFSRCPDMARGGDVGRFVQRSALDAGPLRPTLGLMPEPRTAVRAEGTFDPSTAVGRARPELWHALRHTQTLARDYERNAKGRGGLSPAFLAMTYIKVERFALAFIPHLAALASAGSHPFAPFLTVRKNEEQSVSARISMTTI